MLTDVLARIEQRLKATDQNATAASKKAGLGADAIRNMRRAAENDDRQGVSTRTLELLAPVLQTTASWLLEGVGQEGLIMVPVLGNVGADPEGRVLFAHGDAPNTFVTGQAGGTTNAAALQVVGDSMRGLADNGALIFFEQQHTPPTPDMLGHIVVVETDTDEVLIKRLLRGSKKSLYDLQSISGTLRQDVRIRWAAHISAIVPPWMARKIMRSEGAAA